MVLIQYNKSLAFWQIDYHIQTMVHFHEEQTCTHINTAVMLVIETPDESLQVLHNLVCVLQTAVRVHPYRAGERCPDLLLWASPFSLP